MSTTALDVNAAFAAERASQIATAQREASGAAAADRNTAREASFAERVARGEIRPLGGNRFEVTGNGWDRGEVLILQREAETGRELILPEHGLAEQPDGTVKVYASVPMWTGLGTVIPGGLSSVDAVMDLAGIGWEVSKRQAYFRGRGANRGFKVHDGQFSLVRDDTDEPIGKCGSGYAVIQNRDGFSWLQDLVDDSDVIWESAGQVRDGGRVFISMRLPETIRIDAEGVNDEVVPFLVVLINHTGMDTNKALATPWRPVCGNTERFATRDAFTSWSIWHTSGAKQRMEQARRSLGLSFKYYESFAAEETALAHTDLSVDALLASIEALWPQPKIGPDIKTERGLAAATTRWSERRENIVKLYDDNAARLGRTAYAGERSITEYLDHQRTVRVPKTLTEELARATRVIEGTDDEDKTVLHRQLLTLTNR